MTSLVILKTLYVFITIYCFKLCLTQKDFDDNSLKKCPGGYCVELHLCMKNNTINTEEEFDINIRNNFGVYPIIVSTNKDDNVDPCEEFILRCCPNRSEPYTATNQPDYFPEPPSPCGNGYPDGYIYHVRDDSVAQYGEFPWTAALFQIGGASHGSLYICGGSLIHPQVILTAAHCLRNITHLDHLLVRLGEWDFANAHERYKHQDFAVRKIIKHENWHPQANHNDLALLILTKAASLGPSINTICLPELDQSFVDEQCVAVGWGKDVRKQRKYADLLKKIKVPVIEHGRCQQMLRQTRLTSIFRLDSSFMCAGGEAGVDTCKGDGGSPLMCVRGDGRYVQAGLVAWGIDCGREGVPGVYVKVAKFVQWIKDTIEGEGLMMV